MAMPLWLREKLFQKTLLRDELKTHAPDFDWHNKLLFAEHHQSHAASAFFPSPFEEAAVLTMDGVGEWATTSLAHGKGHDLEMLRELHFPHSIGLLYSAFTYYTGFKVNSGEYKVMGLAPYGEPRFLQTILDNLVDLKEDGTFRLDQSYFDYCTGLRMTNAKFDTLFGGPARTPEKLLTQREMDLAASVQAVTERSCCACALGAQGDRPEEPLPGRRRGAELRRQRQGASRRHLRPDLGAAGGRRRRRRGGRGLRRLSRLPPPAARAQRQARRHGRLLSRPELRRRRRTAPEGRRRRRA